MGKTLGKKIRELRKRRGLTQNDLGQGLVTSSMISQIEADKANPSHQLLTLLAQKLETPVDYFLQIKQEEHERYAKLSLANALVQAGRYSEAYELLIQLNDPLQGVPETNRTIRTNRTSRMNSIAINGIDEMHLIEFLIGVCELETGKWLEAEDRFETLIETALSLQDVSFYLNVSLHYGRCYWRTNRIETAAHIWNRAIEYAQLHQQGYDPLILDLHLKLGEAYDELGRQQQAQKSYEQAQQIYGHFTNWNQVLDHLLKQAVSCYRDQHHRASAYFSQEFMSIQSAFRRANNSYQTSVRLAVSLAQNGQIEEGRRILNDIRNSERFADHSLQWYVAKARIDSWAGDYDSAYAALCDRFPFDQPADKIQADGFALVGEVLLHYKRYQEAERVLQAALDWHLRHEAESSILTDYELLGNLYKQQGNLEAAIECHEQIHKRLRSATSYAMLPNSIPSGNGP